MRVKVLSLALLAVIMALPAPASQLLAGTFSAPSPAVRIVPGDANLALLLQDPFRIDQLSYGRPTSLL
ncbi:MAG: hypothetical protein KIT69_20330 [Propionibacteriaceae bacterium]|nr:hypothetical protein [Propionibacteriaceae bacterium]